MFNLKIDDVFFIPLNIPLLPFKNRNEIIDLFSNYKSPVNKPSDSKIPEFWEGFTCYKKEGTDDSELLYPGKFVDIKELLIDEISILNEYLPVEVETISLWSNKILVPAHVDQKVYNQEKDFRFRFVLIQEEPSFFINYNEKNRYIKMPDDSSVFAFNNYACKHGASLPKGKKILGIIRGRIYNYDKLVHLLESSVEKYKNFLIDKNNI